MVPQVIKHYRILDKFGAGGMGEVYRAEDLKLHRTVAIKAVRIDRTGNTTSRTEALREAIAVSQIVHPNVVTLFEVIEEEDVLYLVMECVQGRTLRSILTEKRPSLDEALHIGCEVAAGLKAVHAAGEVHRDIKPENIMVTPEGTCKILDFGIAHLTLGTTITRDGMVAGTPHYMAPEQVQGGAVDARADIYSLGVVLYEILSGRLPFPDREWPALLGSILRGEPVPLTQQSAGVPPDLERIVATAMARDRDRRYAGAGDLKQDLELVRKRLADAGHIPTSKALYSARGARPGGRLRRAAPVLAVLLIAALAIGLKEYLRRHPPNPAPGPFRVMVAPFANTRGDSHLAWLSGGIMDCLIAGLGHLEGCEIVHRHTVTSAVDIAPYQAAFFSDAGLLGAAREAGASYLVTGSYTANGPVVRIACELNDLKKGTVLGSWTRDLTNIERDFFPAVDAIAADLASRLRTTRTRPAAGGSRGTGYDTQSVAAMQQFERGIEGFERRDFETARSGFEAAVAADSLFARAYLYLALSSTEAADCETSMTRAMAYRHSAPSPTREVIEAVWNELLGRDTEAIAQYEKILADHPEEMLTRNHLANLYLRRREWAKAIGEFSAERTRNPFDYSFFPSLTIAYVEIGQRDQALRMAENWRARAPSDSAPLQWVIQLNQTFGNYLEALALCDTLSALAPGADLADREVILVLLGRLDQAEECVARWQEDPGLYSRSKPLVQLALIERERGRLGRGVELSRQALAIQDDFYNRWVAGQLAAAGSDFSGAEGHARAIGEYFGNETGDSTTAEAFAMRRFYFNLEGEIALARGDAPGAVSMHERALHYSGQADDPPFRTPFGVALLAAGDTARAMAAFERVLAFNPNYPEALLCLGRAARARGDRERALAALGRLTPLWREADPDYAPNREREELLAGLLEN